MAWKLRSSEVATITTKLASEFSEMEPAPEDRPLSERRLMVYERNVREGQFRTCTWAKAICEETGETYRVNGKHTSRLFVTLAEEYKGLGAVVEAYDCETLADVSRLYATFDAAIMSRKANDIYHSFAATIPELACLPPKIIENCANGIDLHKRGGVVVAGNIPADRAELLLEYPEFVIWVAAIIGDPYKYRQLCRKGVTAAMFSNWQKSSKEATEFWTMVRDEKGAHPNCPDRQLAKWLLLTSVTATNMQSSLKKKKADARQFYVVCLNMWNAWRRKEEIKLIKYYPAKDVPVAI